MTPVFLSRVGANPSILSYNIRGDDGKIIKAKDEKGKMKAVVYAVLLASVWGKSYLLRKEGWSLPMGSEQDVIDTFFDEVEVK